MAERSRRQVLSVITFELVTLEGIKFHDTVHEVLIPTPDGQIAVFKNHAPLISLAASGVIGVRRSPDHPDDMIEQFATTGGVVEVSPGGVRMLVDEAAGSDELDEDEARKALERAKEMRAEAKDHISVEKAQQLIERRATELHVAELKKRHRKQPSSNN